MRLFACLPAVATILWATTSAAHHPAVEGGGTYIAGSFQWTSSGGDLFEDDGDRLTQIELTPSFGYFVADGLGLGVAIGFSRLSQGDSSFYNLAVGPQLTYYFDTGGNALPFFTGEVRLRTLGDSGDSETGFGLAFTGGVEILASESLGVGIGLTYAYDHFDIGGLSLDGNHIGTAVGLTGFFN